MDLLKTAWASVVGIGRLALVPAMALPLLAGCAATVQQGSTAGAPLPARTEAAQNVVLNVTGSSVSTQSDDWEPFKGEWRSAMAAAASARGAAFSVQEGSPRPTGEAGTLVVVDVADYRYLSTGARIGLGAFSGNAYVDSTVRFLDLRTGAVLGQRDYDTSSSAWQGVFAPMTGKQVQAIAEQVMADIAPR